MLGHEAAKKSRALQCLICLLVLLCLWLMNHSRFASHRSSQLKRVGNNPDQFHLWTTNAQFDYAFTYDPHAADDWMFDSAAVARNQEAGLPPIRSAEAKSNRAVFRFLSREEAR